MLLTVRLLLEEGRKQRGKQKEEVIEEGRKKMEGDSKKNRKLGDKLEGERGTKMRKLPDSSMGIAVFSMSSQSTQLISSQDTLNSIRMLTQARESSRRMKNVTWES